MTAIDQWFPPEDTWPCLETTLVVTGGAQYWYLVDETRALLNTLQCMGQPPPQQRTIQPKMLMVPRMRNLEDKS